MVKITATISKSTALQKLQLLSLAVFSSALSYILWASNQHSAQMLKGVICGIKGGPSCESEVVSPVVSIFGALASPIVTISVAMLVPGLLVTGVLLQAGHRRAGTVAGSLMAGLILVAASGPIAS